MKSIRYVFGALFSLLILVSVGLVASVSVMMQFREADESAAVLMSMIGGRVEDLIDLEFKELTSLERIYARQIETSKASLKNGLHDETFIKEMIESVRTQSLMSGVKTLSFVDEKGRCLALDRRRTATPVVKLCDLSKSGQIRWYSFEGFGKTRPPMEYGQMPSDIRRDPSFEEAIRRHEVVISDLHPSYWSEGSQAISAHEALFESGGQFRLMVSSELDIRSIAVQLQGLTTPDGTSISLLDRQGHLLASSLRQSDEDSGITDPAALPSISLNRDPGVRASALAIKSPGEGHLVEKEATRQIRINDQSYYVYVAPVARDRIHDWSVAIAIPQRALISHILNGIQITAWITGALLILAILCGIFLAGWVTRPILTLGQAARALERNQLEEPFMPFIALSRDALGKNEFGKLARLFLKMIEEVRSRHRLLEIQLEQLRVDVDSAQTKAEVKEVMETEFFVHLQENVEHLRFRYRDTEV
jgi:HAMP domain-containing protein